MRHSSKLTDRTLTQLHKRTPRRDGKVYYPPKPGFEEEAASEWRTSGVCPYCHLRAISGGECKQCGCKPTPEGWDPGGPWRLFREATAATVPRDVAVLATSMLRDDSSRIVVNHLYQVDIRMLAPDPSSGRPAIAHLSIKRRDKEAYRDWRHMQRIKNELVGKECEGVELYPAESRLVDTSNQYHLWVIANTKHRFPFGFEDRLVADGNALGAQQRPFEVRPDDCKNAEEIAALAAKVTGSVQQG